MTLIRDCALWLFCWSCWRTYTWMPFRLCDTRFGFWILSYAGLYAYSTSWADFRETVAWNAAGRPEDWRWRT
jgi:hypothetical protein